MPVNPDPSPKNEPENEPENCEPEIIEAVIFESTDKVDNSASEPLSIICLHSAIVSTIYVYKYLVLEWD